MYWEHSHLSPLRNALCCRTVWSTHAQETSVAPVTQTTHQGSGLPSNLELGAVHAVPFGGLDQWIEETEDQRSQASVQIWQTFHLTLSNRVEKLQLHFGQIEGVDHSFIHSLLKKIHSFSTKTELNLLLCSCSLPPKTTRTTPEISGKMYFKKLLWGRHLLQQLVHWKLKSIHDFRV
uniref:Ciliary neurotrophic factor n=1 Tax=Oryctolagus cuniculus TaxID=9986 RepID=A0A5F9CK49_RABIT